MRPVWSGIAFQIDPNLTLKNGSALFEDLLKSFQHLWVLFRWPRHGSHLSDDSTPATFALQEMNFFFLCESLTVQQFVNQGTAVGMRIIQHWMSHVIDR